MHQAIEIGALAIAIALIISVIVLIFSITLYYIDEIRSVRREKRQRKQMVLRLQQIESGSKTINEIRGARNGFDA